MIDLQSIKKKSTLDDPLTCGVNHSSGLLCYKSGIVPPVSSEGDKDDPKEKDGQDRYEVRIIDNDYNTYEEVIKISMFALGIDFEEAYAIAWEVDHIGSCVVANGPWSECMEIASIIGRIGIETQVNPVKIGPN